MLTRIISGGQTGVDQAALRAAASLGIPIGGWCPPGGCPILSPPLRKGGSESGASEDAAFLDRFPLTETPEERSPRAPDIPRSQRTEWNVRDSDGTLLLFRGELQEQDAGTRWTAECTAHYGKPLLVVDPAALADVPRAHHWIDSCGIHILNVAGPSEGNNAGIGATAERFVAVLLRLDALYEDEP